jgi:hypothetical protein
MAQGRLRRATAFLALIALASCAAPAPTPAPPVPAPPPATTAAPPVQAAPARAPPKPADACGAAALQYLVGRPRTQIPVPVYPDRRRVACSTCVLAPGVVPWRQTIIFDAASGLIKSVACG